MKIARADQMRPAALTQSAPEQIDQRGCDDPLLESSSSRFLAFACAQSPIRFLEGTTRAAL